MHAVQVSPAFGDLKAQIDFKAAYHSLLRGPGKKMGNREYYFCPFHDDQRTPNLTHDENGKFKCFACGENGDVIDLYSHVRGVPNPGEAAQALKAEFGNGHVPLEGGGGPRKAQARNWLHQGQTRAKAGIEEHPDVLKQKEAGYKLVGIYSYADSGDWHPFHRVRMEHETKGKWCRAFYFNGTDWINGEPPGLDPKPLYLSKPEKALFETVYIVEGEKCVDTLSSLGVCAATSGSSTSAHKADWSILKAQGFTEAIIWPDDDDAGRKYSDTVAEKVSALGLNVKKIEVSGLDLPPGGDVVDWLGNHPEGSAEVIKALPTIEAPATVEEDWPDPVLFVQNETPPLPTDILPTWMADYVEAVSLSTQTPQAMAVMLALSVLATCNQKRFEVSPYGDDYTEPLSLWALIVLPSGSRKSAVVNKLTEPLAEWECTQREVMAREIQENETKRGVILKAIERKQAKAGNTDDPSERSILIDDINSLKESLPDELRPPRLWTGDVTPERLQSLMAEHGERMSILADEGGIFETMSGLYSDGKANIDVLLQGYSGSSVRVDRGSRSVSMNSPALSFGLTVQPVIIQELGRGNKKRFRGNGTLARFMYAFPKSNIGHRDHSARAPIPESVRTAYKSRIVGLLNNTISLGTESPQIIRLSDAALIAYLAFSQDIEGRQGPGGDLECIQDWTAKLPGTALRIAGNVHIAENGGADLMITEETMVKALDFCELLIQHTKATFGFMGADPIIEDAKRVLDWIFSNREPTFKRSECHTALRGRFNHVAPLIKALGVLEERNIISSTKKGPEQKPSLSHEVNPKIFAEVNHGMA